MNNRVPDKDPLDLSLSTRRINLGSLYIYFWCTLRYSVHDPIGLPLDWCSLRPLQPFDSINRLPPHSAVWWNLLTNSHTLFRFRYIWYTGSLKRLSMRSRLYVCLQVVFCPRFYKLHREKPHWGLTFVGLKVVVWSSCLTPYQCVTLWYVVTFSSLKTMDDPVST